MDLLRLNGLPGVGVLPPGLGRHLAGKVLTGTILLGLDFGGAVLTLEARKYAGHLSVPVMRVAVPVCLLLSFALDQSEVVCDVANERGST